MTLSNTATPKYYGLFRDAVLRGEIPVCRQISQEMNRIDALIASPKYYYEVYDLLISEGRTPLRTDSHINLLSYSFLINALNKHQLLLCIRKATLSSDSFYNLTIPTNLATKSTPFAIWFLIFCIVEFSFK